MHEIDSSPAMPYVIETSAFADFEGYLYVDPPLSYQSQVLALCVLM